MVEPVVFLLRPFIEVPAAGVGGIPPVLPVIPFPGGFAPIVVCFSSDPGADEKSDPVSQVVLRGLIRVVYDLAKAVSPVSDGWKVFETSFFTRKGPYIVPQCSPDDYEKIFKVFYNRGVILHPVYPGPSILPGEWSDGELKAL